MSEGRWQDCAVCVHLEVALRLRVGVGVRVRVRVCVHLEVALRLAFEPEHADERRAGEGQLQVLTADARIERGARLGRRRRRRRRAAEHTAGLVKDRVCVPLEGGTPQPARCRRGVVEFRAYSGGR